MGSNDAEPDAELQRLLTLSFWRLNKGAEQASKTLRLTQETASALAMMYHFKHYSSTIVARYAAQTQDGQSQKLTVLLHELRPRTCMVEHNIRMLRKDCEASKA
jgi:hypothetical protein